MFSKKKIHLKSFVLNKNGTQVSRKLIHALKKIKIGGYP